MSVHDSIMLMLERFLTGVRVRGFTHCSQKMKNLGVDASNLVSGFLTKVHAALSVGV